MPIRERLTASGEKRYSVHVTYSVDGRETRKQVGTFTRKGDARKAEAEALLKVRNGEFIRRPRAVSVGSLSALYFSTLNVSDRSERRYRSQSVHVINFLGRETPVSSVTKSDIKRMVSYLSKSKSPKYVKCILSTARGMFEVAVEEGIVSSNPVIGVKSGRVPKTDVRVLSTEEHQSLVDAMDEQYRSLVAFWPYVGLRRGEMSALEWSDVCLLGSPRITINKQWVEGWGVDRPKTEESVREVLLCEEAVRILRDHGVRESGLVFSGPEGGHLNDHFFKSLARACEAVGIRGFTSHDFRHTFAAWMLACAPIKFVQKQLGHTSAVITLGTYGHLIPNNEDEMIGMVDEWVSRRNRDISVTSEESAA